jgi:hypothetical protein
MIFTEAFLYIISTTAREFLTIEQRAELEIRADRVKDIVRELRENDNETRTFEDSYVCVS